MADQQNTPQNTPTDPAPQTPPAPSQSGVQPLQTPQVQPQEPKSNRKYFVLIIILVALNLVLIPVGATFWYLQKDKSTPSETSAIQLTPTIESGKGGHDIQVSDSCTSRYDNLAPQVNFPRHDNAVILVTGMFSDDYHELELNTPWYMQTDGKNDWLEWNETEGDIIYQVVDENNNVVGEIFSSTEGVGVIYTEPYGSIETDVIPFAFSVPYAQNTRRFKITVRNKEVFSAIIPVKLLQDAIKEIPDELFIDIEIKNRIENSIAHFDRCIKTNNDLPAARLLEFELLPIVETGLKDDYEEQNVLEISKEEMLTLIKDTIVRLDPKLATATLTPIPDKIANLRVWRGIRKGSSINFNSLDPGEGVRVLEQQFQVEVLSQINPNCIPNNEYPPLVVCQKDAPQSVNLLVTDLNTKLTKGATLSEENNLLEIFNMTIKVARFYPNYTDIWISNVDRPSYQI